MVRRTSLSGRNSLSPLSLPSCCTVMILRLFDLHSTRPAKFLGVLERAAKMLHVVDAVRVLRLKWL